MARIDQLVEELERSYSEAQQRMSDPAVYNDHRQAADAGRKLKELEEPARLAREWRGIAEDLEAARGDGDLRELVPELEERARGLEEDLRVALAPKDPADAKDVLLEVRGAAGGDEAALWAAEVARMLQRYAYRRSFRTETLSTNESEGGGIKETTFAVKGDGAYSVFKFEGGTHRVQRVPVTESQGRIHTSTATVAVMPEAEDVEVDLDENKLKAMRVLRARLYDLEREKQQAELAQQRRSQIGSGERAEKIRTYNFPESRVTDHRVKLTEHRLEQILSGELDSFTEALQEEERRRALE